MCYGIRMNKFKPLIGVLIFSISTSAFAVTPADERIAIEKQSQIESFTKAQLEQEKRLKRRRQLEKPGAKIEIAEPEEIKDIIEPTASFMINEIVLTGANTLSKRRKRKLIEPYINQELNINDINHLMRDVTNFYMKKGFVTTRAYIPKQNLNDGTLELIVIEGFLEDIVLGDNSLRNRLAIATAFPGFKSKILNLRDIEQGLDQINRLSSNNATMKLYPGEMQGGSKLVVKNQPHDLCRVYVGYDNSGQKSTGTYKKRITLQNDNLLGLNDNITLSYNKDAVDKDWDRNSSVVSGNVSIPYGYWTVSYSYNESDYLTKINGVVSKFESTGDTETNTVRVDRVLYRDKNSKFSAHTALVLKEILNYIEDVKINSSSRRLSVLNIGISYLLRAMKSVFTAGFSYFKGLNSFNAKTDPDVMNQIDPKAQFEKFEADLSWYRPWMWKNRQWSFRTTAHGQYSNHSLYSSEQINIGDKYSVRGYKERFLQGNSGFYLRNELLFPLPKFRNKLLNKLTNNLSPFVGFDAGFARNDAGLSSRSNEKEAWMTGWCVGTRYNDNGFLSFDVTYSQALKSPDFLDEKSHEIYFSVSLKVW